MLVHNDPSPAFAAAAAAAVLPALVSYLWPNSELRLHKSSLSKGASAPLQFSSRLYSKQQVNRKTLHRTNISLLTEIVL